jgi:hypothetical protein
MCADLPSSVGARHSAADNSYHASVAHERIKETVRARLATQIATVTTPNLAGLVANGTVRPSEGPRYFPTPIKLLGAGKNAASYVVEDRR